MNSLLAQQKFACTESEEIVEYRTATSMCSCVVGAVVVVRKQRARPGHF